MSNHEMKHLIYASLVIGYEENYMGFQVHFYAADAVRALAICRFPYFKYYISINSLRIVKSQSSIDAFFVCFLGREGRADAPQ